MAIKMQIRRGLAAAWASANPTLEPGELGFVTDAGTTAFKIGDGATVWNSLAYVNSTYPELPVDASLNLNLALAQGRYPLSSANTYTSTPAIPAAEYVQGATDGNSVLTVTVPSNGIVIQQINTSVTAKQFLRAYNGTTWTSWKRIDTLAAADSLSIASITLSSNLTVGGIISVSDGSAAAPSITNTGDTDTGLYFPAGDNQVGITTNGVSKAVFGATTAVISCPLSITGAVSVTGAVGATANLSGLGCNVGTNGITSTGGLTVTAGTTELAVPLALRTAATVGASVFSTKNTGGNVVTTIRGDGAPTAGTDLTTKSYVDGQVAGVTFREIMIIATTSATDGNYVVGGTVVTGVISGGTAIKLFLLGSVPTFTYVSNIAASTVTWSNFSSGGRAHLVPSAGTWSVSCPAGGTGLTFTAIRTA